jgi:hypothetical protein
MHFIQITVNIIHIFHIFYRINHMELSVLFLNLMFQFI